MNSAKLKMIISMVIFGTIGIFVEYIPVERSVVAVARGFMGALFIFLFMLISRKKISFADIKKNFLLLALTGGLIGINWILLFASYESIGVPNGTLCYYLAPVFLVIGAFFLYKEKITLLKGICIFVALFGMVFVSGVVPLGGEHTIKPEGILMGVGAAVFYAAVILINRRIKNISPYDMTMVQLFFAAVVALPYVLLTQSNVFANLDLRGGILLVIVGIVHTGIAYVLYFGAVRSLSAQSTAVLSYIDPMVAIVLSATPLLGETLTPWGILGAVMILGSALLSELKKK